MKDLAANDVARSPAMQLMTLDMLQHIVALANNPGELGEYVVQEMRELTGARLAALCQGATPGDDGNGRVVSLSPQRRKTCADSPAFSRLAAHVADGPSPLAWTAQQGDTTARSCGEQLGFETGFGVPLRVGDDPVGALLLLSIPDTWRMQTTVAALEVLAPVVAALLSHATQFGRLEAEVEARTGQLRASETRFRTLFEQAADGIFLFRPSPDGSPVIADVNPSGAALHGYTREELIGRPLTRIDPVMPPEKMHSIAESLRGKEETIQFEAQHRHRDGSPLWLEVSARELTIDGERHFLSAERDISDRKRLEEARRDLEARLRQSQKMEAIGTLAGGIAHDFNNILGAVLGYTELTLISDGIGPEARENLGEVLRAGTRAKELVKQILMFSRKQQEKREPVLIHLVVEEAAKLLRQTIPANFPLHTDLDPHTGTVIADPTQLHQIVMNLGTNAYHAMRETGGTLEVRLEAVDVGAATASHYPDLQEGRYAQLTVADTGTGMDPLTLARIFDPFFTTKGIGEGTGMGLSVVHGIVCGHGGTIGVESSLGTGTTFTVFLPLASTAATADAAVEVPHRGHEHILVVDDEPALAQILSLTLAGLGYRVTAVSTPHEALARFRAAPQTFDLLLTDQAMPEMTGDRLAREVMAIRPGFPVIICTGYSEVLDDERARALGVRALLLKPVGRLPLAQALRRVLDAPG